MIINKRTNVSKEPGPVQSQESVEWSSYPPASEAIPARDRLRLTPSSSAKAHTE